VKAVVLVGGEGTRLRPLTYTRPKQMLPVAEVTMIERVLGHLRKHGVAEAVLSLGYRPDAFRAAFPASEAAGVSLEYVVEPEPLDTAGAIAFAARRAGLGETFVALNGDVLTGLDVGELVRLHRRMQAEATVHLTPVEDPSRFGVVDSDSDGWVTAFVEKPARKDAPTNLINAGTYVLEPSVLSRIDAGRPVSIEREIFPALVEDRSLLSMATRDYWVDAGTPEQYLKACLDLAAGEGNVGEGGRPAPDARREAGGPWLIGRPSLLGDADGRCLLGDASQVASGAAVSSSVVGRRARVEEGARVSASVMLPGSVVCHEAVLDRSVLGAGAVVSKGAVARGCVLGDGAVVEAGAELNDARVPDPASAPGGGSGG
jgi:mannose-1-phosphate guanylyltransferase